MKQATRAMKFLSQKRIAFEVLQYEHEEKGAVFASQATGFPLERTIKTLVTDLGGKRYALALMPGDQQLNLKKIAQVFSVKKADMADSKDAERLTGYLVGGKTGTADKFDPNGRGYLRGAVIASFVAVFPLEAPRYVVLVMLDEPRGDAGSRGLRYGGWTAAPVAREIISRIGPVLGVPPSSAVARAGFEDRLLTTQRAQPGKRKEERIAAVVPRG